MVGIADNELYPHIHPVSRFVALEAQTEEAVGQGCVRKCYEPEHRHNAVCACIETIKRDSLFIAHANVILGHSAMLQRLHALVYHNIAVLDNDGALADFFNIAHVVACYKEAYMARLVKLRKEAPYSPPSAIPKFALSPAFAYTFQQGTYCAQKKVWLMVILSAFVTLGFFLTSFASYWVSLNSMWKQVPLNDLPLTSDNIFSEIQRDILSPVFISSLMASDTFVRD